MHSLSQCSFLGCHWIRATGLFKSRQPTSPQIFGRSPCTGDRPTTRPLSTYTGQVQKRTAARVIVSFRECRILHVSPSCKQRINEDFQHRIWWNSRVKPWHNMKTNLTSKIARLMAKYVLDTIKCASFLSTVLVQNIFRSDKYLTSYGSRCAQKHV
jgi:hypothetical protein